MPTSENQAFWIKILGILSELPTEYLPALLEVLQNFYEPILEKYRTEYREFEQEEIIFVKENMIK